MSSTPTSERDLAIAAIKHGLKARSGKAWSVTGGRGTAWGWITIHVPPQRRTEYGGMSDDDRAHLALLLDLDEPVHHQGVSIPAGSDYRREYVARATGQAPTVKGVQYWD